MKLLVFILILLKYLFTSKNVELLNNYLSNRMKASMSFKVATNNLLENLFFSSNLKKICHNSDMKTKFRFRNRYRKNDNLEHYKYHTYDEIRSELNFMAKKHKDFLEIKTAQDLYKLPNPGGYCGKSRDKCFHYIAFLTDHKIENKNKHQIYISGSVHGNEKVGPNATLELIKLFLNNKDKNPWIKYLLETRLIVITPMTNPNGYDHSEREELIKDNIHHDINRDFPYLVESNKCMRTIGGRVVNELFLSHIFSLSLTLHGGIESLSYPFGAPNHLKDNKYEIPLKYHAGGIQKFPETDDLVKKYKNGDYNHLSGTSSEAPDLSAFSNIANTASFNCANEHRRYETGDMSNIVYPVTGGMEDWAYAGSWEGEPIITQPCTPTEYNGYDKEKTLYNKNHKDALKSIMFLLEISKSKIPSRELLGHHSKNDECILNLTTNAFNIFDESHNKFKLNKQKCLDENNDGYINRVLRLSLTLIDLLIPHINVRHSKSQDGKSINISWVVGGAITVDETFLMYKYVDNKESIIYKNEDEIFASYSDKSKVYNGKATWDTAFDHQNDIFKHTLQKLPGKQFLQVIALARVDKNWLKQTNPIPNLIPQTHLVNLRNNKNYQAKNGNFILQGREYYFSEVYNIKMEN